MIQFFMNVDLMNVKELRKRSIMSGRSMEKLEKDQNMNGVGPGQYHQDLIQFGKNHNMSKLKNAPGFSMGKPRALNDLQNLPQKGSAVLNPETKQGITSPHKTPSPMDYQIPTDNIKFKKFDGKKIVQK